MGPQEVCLISENMGHRYMDMFDRLRPEIRARLREATVNICLACLDEHTRGDPRLQMEMIHQIEKGKFDERSFGYRGSIPSARNYREEERLFRLYESARDPFADLYDPDRRARRDFGDAFARSVQQRFSERRWEYRVEPSAVDFRSPLSATEMIEPIIIKRLVQVQR